jgi:DNA-binding response OmpR family regulator
MEGQYVLAIGHDWRLQKLLRANLEAVGLAVREAFDIQQGLELLRENRPGLILLDLDGPGAEASALLGALEAQGAGRPVPVIVMSAEPPGRWLMRHTPAVSHLQKPFAASVLVRQVRQALDDAAADGQVRSGLAS